MNPRAIRFAAISAMALGVSLTTAHGAAVLSGADTFGNGGNAFTIDFVDIGNAGNADDVNNPAPNPGDGGTPFGGVSYVYRMGVTEVPQDWFTKATNLGMTNVTAGAWTGLQPAADMTWFQAAAFVNWLNTSTGHQAAYQLNASNTTLTLWSSAQAWRADGQNLYRHKDAYYFLPSEDEWYKAAYHKNNGVTADYWDYATGSNTIPTAVAGGTSTGTAVYDEVNNGVPVAPAAVNNAGGLSAYGTMGQNGNVWEWQESAFDGINDSSSEFRPIRGCDWHNFEGGLRSSTRNIIDPSGSHRSFGFRVASVPEPSCAMLMLSGSLLALARRRRRFGQVTPGVFHQP